MDLAGGTASSWLEALDPRARGGSGGRVSAGAAGLGWGLGEEGVGDWISGLVVLIKGWGCGRS
jgi:hypothetical protein